jgi:acyl-[acyl-carrier-protein] desaturase
MIGLTETVRKEIKEMRPRTPPGLLSRQEKDRLIERGLVGLYRWYVDRSQATRNWNADRGFDWRSFRTDHSHEVNVALEGFFAVEQYVPDYVSKLIGLLRKSHGRTQFQVRWGSEEERHIDAWLNTVRFSRYRSAKWVEDYRAALLETEWAPPWDDPLHMLFYTLIQERATQMNYLHMAAIAAGANDKLPHDVDPVLQQVCRAIAVDEAAHYNFFLESSRLWLYYYPAHSLEALVDVVKSFLMPGHDIIPSFKEFEEVCAGTGVYGPRQHAGDVLQVVFKTLNVRLHKALVAGVKRTRDVPDPDGNMRDTSLFEAIDYGAVTQAVERLHGRIEKYEQDVGLSAVDPTRFVPSGMGP